MRRYRLVPGSREKLIALFDREFVETQEAVGMRVIGQFRDMDEPHSFVWLREFADMPARAEALTRFYGGPVWAAHRDAANATMVNSDNVLLLRPSHPGAGFAPAQEPRASVTAQEVPPGLVVSHICYLAPRTEVGFAEFFEVDVAPLLERASARVAARLMTTRTSNNFPRLPVREGETAFVWFTTFPSLQAYDDHLSALAGDKAWTDHALPEMERRTWRQNEVSRLMPTTRSLLHG
ncbi:MAG: hypothetical protein K0R58_90 [Ramlibacter sp.]|jgi:hypothetical protein|nr:hypothetical protein [Ramlibacter sp.]